MAFSEEVHSNKAAILEFVDRQVHDSFEISRQQSNPSNSSFLHLFSYRIRMKLCFSKSVTLIGTPQRAVMYFLIGGL